MIDEEKMDSILLELGFGEVLAGTGYLREAVRQYAGGRTQITGEVYTAVAEVLNTTNTAVERCIRHAIGRSLQRGNPDVIHKVFGWTLNVETGVPTVGECIARLARFCRAN